MKSFSSKDTHFINYQVIIHFVLYIFMGGGDCYRFLYSSADVRTSPRSLVRITSICR